MSAGRGYGQIRSVIHSDRRRGLQSCGRFSVVSRGVSGVDESGFVVTSLMLAAPSNHRDSVDCAIAVSWCNAVAAFVSKQPLQLLFVEVLQRPIEFTLRPAIAVMDEFVVAWSPVQRLLERAEREVTSQ
ncbi:MAG: hypothetical protein ABJE66_08920 [Deltaproteobacteria bacterium]